MLRAIGEGGAGWNSGPPLPLLFIQGDRVVKAIKRESPKPKRRTAILAIHDRMIGRANAHSQWAEVLAVAPGQIELPPRRIVPLIDTERRSLLSVIGSVRNIRVDGDRLLGDLVFAKSQAAQDAMQKWDDGHCRYLRPDVEPLAVDMLGSFRRYSGPVKYISRWRLVCVVMKPTLAYD